METTGADIRKMHGVAALTAAVNTVNNKAKGIAENADEINFKMREILDIIDNPVPDRRIKDYE